MKLYAKIVGVKRDYEHLKELIDGGMSPDLINDVHTGDYLGFDLHKLREADVARLREWHAQYGFRFYVSTHDPDESPVMLVPINLCGISPDACTDSRCGLIELMVNDFVEANDEMAKIMDAAHVEIDRLENKVSQLKNELSALTPTCVEENALGGSS